MDYAEIMKKAQSMIERYTARQIRRLNEDRKAALADAKRAAEDIRSQREMLGIYQSIVKEFAKPVKWPKMRKSYIGPDGKRHRIPKSRYIGAPIGRTA